VVFAVAPAVTTDEASSLPFLLPQATMVEVVRAARVEAEAVARAERKQTLFDTQVVVRQKGVYRTGPSQR